MLALLHGYVNYQSRERHRMGRMNQSTSNCIEEPVAELQHFDPARDILKA